MRWFAIITAVVILAIIATSAAMILLVDEEQEAAFAAFDATTVTADTIPQTVPFRMVAGHIVVDVLLGDAEEAVPIILDTGAPMTLSDELADQYGGKVAGQVSIAAIDGTILNVDVVPITSVDIGGAVFTDVGATKGFLDLDNPLSCISPHGLIGASLMRTAVWQIDYASNEITIAPSVDDLDHIEGASRIEFTVATPTSPSPIVEIRAGDGTLTFLVDTGSDGWLTLNPADVEAIGAGLGTDAPRASSMSAGEAGTFLSEIAWTAADLAFGDLALDGVPLATVAALAEGQGNIGNGFLSQFIVTFDWPGSALYLEATGDDIAPPLPASAGFTWGGERILVGSVVRASNAEAAGVETDVPVTAIDGVDVSSATRDDYCALANAPTTDSFEMTLGGDQPLTIAVAPVTDFYDALRG
jgi:predicted aspartyl protease